jgi:hypothetical protein
MKKIYDFNSFVNESNDGLKITNGQHNVILKAFPDYDREKSYIIVEGGNDNGDTYTGSFLVKIYKKNSNRSIGIYRFDDGKLTKKVK